MFYNMRDATRKFLKIMHRIQERLHDSIQLDRAKMNVLKLKWEMALEKLIFSYIKKNETKEFS